MEHPVNVRPIRTDQDHRAALAEIEACWGAPDGSEEGDRLDVLVTLVESYEARRWLWRVVAPSRSIRSTKSAKRGRFRLISWFDLTSSKPRHERAPPFGKGRAKALY
jgi:hypothetical protein